MVQELNQETFDTFLQSDKPVVVDFFATWCGPCKVLGPIIEEIAQEYKDQIEVAKVDVDANPEIASRYEVMSIPTLVVLNKGNVVTQLVGLRSKPDLVGLLGLGDF